MLKLILLDGNRVRYGRYDSIGVLSPHETYRGRFSVMLGAQTPKGKNRVLLGIGDAFAIFADVENAVDVTIEVP